MSNIIKINFKVTEYNGYPSIRIFLNDQMLVDHQFSTDLWTFEFPVDTELNNHSVRVERYGKTDVNCSLEKDQIVEITGLEVDGTKIPFYIFDKQSKFEFNNEVHLGSRYFGPNGVWTWNFKTPIITYLLDQKIIHEAQYDQDYEYPWSYKLGPDSVNTMLSWIKKIEPKIYE